MIYNGIEPASDDSASCVQVLEKASQMGTPQPPSVQTQQPPDPYFAQGVNGQLAVTPDRIVISRKGFLAFMTQGLKGDKEIPLANITAVQMKQPGLATNGYIQFSILGGIEDRGGLFDATKDENTVMYSKKQQEVFRYVKELIDYYHQQQRQQMAPVLAPAAALSTADELVKWASLRDQGIISNEEFEAKKRRLLEL